jgi:hypothetical protein
MAHPCCLAHCLVLLRQYTRDSEGMYHPVCIGSTQKMVLFCMHVNCFDACTMHTLAHWLYNIITGPGPISTLICRSHESDNKGWPTNLPLSSPSTYTPCIHCVAITNNWRSQPLSQVVTLRISTSNVGTECMSSHNGSSHPPRVQSTCPLMSSHVQEHRVHVLSWWFQPSSKKSGDTCCMLFLLHQEES